MDLWPRSDRWASGGWIYMYVRFELGHPLARTVHKMTAIHVHSPGSSYPELFLALLWDFQMPSHLVGKNNDKNHCICLQRKTLCAKELCRQGWMHAPFLMIATYQVGFGKYFGCTPSNSLTESLSCPLNSYALCCYTAEPCSLVGSEWIAPQEFYPLMFFQIRRGKNRKPVRLS